jgi:AAA+ superfamily predicted ATPase
MSAQGNAAAMTDAERWEYALEILAARVTELIEAEHIDGDVADSQRGKSFPIPVILREAAAGRARAASGAIPWNALPESLTVLPEYLPLTDLDLALLLCAAAPTLDPRFERFYIVLNNDVDARGPLVSTALRLAGLSLLDSEARGRLRADAPLVALGLVDVGPAHRPLGSRVITVPERVIAYLVGDALPDALVLRGVAVPEHDPLPREMLPELPSTVDLPAIFRGRAGTAALEQARRFILDTVDLEPIVVDLSRVEFDHQAPRTLARALAREVALSGRPLVLDCRHCGTDVPIVALVGEFIDIDAPIITVVDARRDLGAWARQAVTMPLPSAAQRQAWWASLAPEADQSLALIATHIDPEDLQRMATSASSTVLAPARSGQRKSRITTVAPAVSLDDVVLDDRSEDQVRELVDRVRYRWTVLDEWNMRPGGSRGRGVTALFAGESGTGKSMSAEAIAGELGVPLFSVDLASIIDKYIGETEKNLEEVFRAVENDDGVLLFDEADALFGKRSDVSDARDRYANIEVAYLLQRIESFDGLAILTTNLRANLDEAFQRRLDMIIDFPEPDASARELIWRRALSGFPDALDDADFAALAALDMTGGYIRAAAISAAYKAAAQGETIQRRHILAGARGEWRKSGRLNFPDAAFAGWTETA